jgi:hypothetical protein
MRRKKKDRCPCVSSRHPSAIRLDTNGSCHGFTGGVNLNGGTGRICQPQIVLVLWDHFYISTPQAVTQAQLLISDLVGGPFMNGIAQYGISRGSLLNTIVLDTNTHAAPASWDSTGNSDGNQIKAWLNDGTLTPQSTPTTLYFLFLPTTMQLTNGKNKDGTPNTNVCGWHSSDGNLFWGLVRTDGADQTTANSFVNSFAFCVSHELVEAFTDCDGNTGYYSSNGCEIGDICETKAFFAYRGWTVEQYWSNWDSACIHGDQPVSVRKFVKGAGFSPIAGLRDLHFSRIGLDTIARFECLTIT